VTSHQTCLDVDSEDLLTVSDDDDGRVKSVNMLVPSMFWSSKTEFTNAAKRLARISTLLSKDKPSFSTPSFTVIEDTADEILYTTDAVRWSRHTVDFVGLLPMNAGTPSDDTGHSEIMKDLDDDKVAFFSKVWGMGCGLCLVGTTPKSCIGQLANPHPRTISISRECTVRRHHSILSVKTRMTMRI
jgi:hypothetical protein